MRWLAILPLLLALLVPAVADGKKVRSIAITAPTGQCSTHAAGGIGCFGDAVPAGMLDGYLWLKKRGKVRIAESGGVLNKQGAYPVRVRPGDRWNKKGVRCRVIPGGIKCSNGQHGFRLKKRGYRIW